MTSCISPIYGSVVPRPYISLPHVSRRGSVPLCIPAIPPIIFPANLQPPQDQPILQTPDSSSYAHNINTAQPPTSSVKSLKRTLYLDGNDDEASALKKFLLFQYPRKSQKVDMKSWSTNPSSLLSSKTHLTNLSDSLTMFAKTLSGNDKGVFKQICMASALDDGVSQTTDTNKEIVSSLQKFMIASNKKGGNIPTHALQAKEAVIRACKFTVQKNWEMIRTAIGVSKRLFYKKNNGTELPNDYRHYIKKKEDRNVQSDTKSFFQIFVTQMRAVQ